jgi:hypothetical protein
VAVTARPLPDDELPLAQARAARRTGLAFPPELDGLPPSSALQHNPELATLAVLHTTLETLVLALVAFYPDVAAPDPPHDRATLAAKRLLVSVGHFQHRLTRYCRDLAARRAPPVPSPDDALY